MGCEAHPDEDGRVFECSGDLKKVYSPYYVSHDESHGENGVAGDVEYPHWNGAEAFARSDQYVESHSMPTAEARLTETPGTMTLVEFATESLRKVA